MHLARSASVFLLLASSVACYATKLEGTPLAPGETVTPSLGTYGGVQDGNTISHTSNGVTYFNSVYTDPNNPICSGCLDFLIQLSAGSGASAENVNTSSFNGFTTSVAYADDGSEAPDMVSRSANGNKITFDFAPYLYDGTSDSLIIYTNATAYDENGGITVGAIAVDPAGYQPVAAGGSSVTPEPSSLALFGTGILGLGGVLRKRFA